MPRLLDGFPSYIDFTFKAVGGIEIWELSITPGGIDGGGANDTTSMRNRIWRTMQPKYLKTLTEGSASCAYDPVFYDTMVEMCNINQEMTITLPDQSTYTFWGWINTFTPNEIVEGEQPTAELTFIPSNQDNNGDEVCPVLILGAGRLPAAVCP